MANKEEIIRQINETLEQSPTGDQKQKVKKQVEALSKLIPDTKVYREIVWVLGIAVLLSVVALGVLAGLGKTIPEALTALASAGVGALAGAITLK